MSKEKIEAVYYVKQDGKFLSASLWKKTIEELKLAIEANITKNPNKQIIQIIDPEIVEVIRYLEERSPIGYLRDHLSDVESSIRNIRNSIEFLEDSVMEIDEIVKSDQTCKWNIEKIDNLGDVRFSTKCYNEYYCGTENPNKSGFKYCPGCGKDIEF